MAPHSSTLAWKTPWTEEPGRLQSMGSLPGTPALGGGQALLTPGTPALGGGQALLTPGTLALGGGCWPTGASSLRDSGRPCQRPFQAGGLESARCLERTCMGAAGAAQLGVLGAARPSPQPLRDLPGRGPSQCGRSFTTGPPCHGWTVSRASPAYPRVPVSDLGAWGLTQLQPRLAFWGPAVPPAGTDGSVSTEDRVPVHV